MVRTLACKLVGASSKKMRRKRDIPRGLSPNPSKVTKKRNSSTGNRVCQRPIPAWQKKITDFFKKVQ